MIKSHYNIDTNNDLSVIHTESEPLIILAGNPNVGKSTLFNALTGLRQHTGNWTGKTVASAIGSCVHNGRKYLLADVPGCYSLKAHSADEVCAGNAICSGDADGVIVVCDAGALERNLNLVLQICEARSDVTVCLNLFDEAAKRGIHIDCIRLQKELGIPVVKINARKKRGIEDLFDDLGSRHNTAHITVSYGKKIEKAVDIMTTALNGLNLFASDRYIALRLLENDSCMWQKMKGFLSDNTLLYTSLVDARHRAMNYLFDNGIEENDLLEIIAINLVRTAGRIAKACVKTTDDTRPRPQIIADRILTGKYTGFMIMLIMLSLIFYITLKWANYPSAFLSKILFSLELPIYSALKTLHFPEMLCNMLVFGGYRVLAWVVSVMLPPMAIFFPLFTVFEDIGYLPRVAFNLDKAFKKCNACGKQALTTCMGFGCNAAAVTGARIIDSPRERLIAIISNAFIPCNGRFPFLISLICIFFAGTDTANVTSAILLSLFVVLAVLTSLGASKLLSVTLLRGVPSSFALELPPYRRPQIGQILIRSLFDRTVFVLFRAMVVAFPSGIIIWLLTNISVSQNSLASHLITFLSPLGKLMGMDGIMLSAFLLGIPANEIVLPLALMMYSSGSALVSDYSLSAVSTILSSAGWTSATALCAIVFSIMHWPCSSTLMTIKKESKSLKWTVVSFLFPTLFGIAFCTLINALSHILSLVF